MTTFISLDTETWGKRAGCDLRSIGATVFHPYQIDAVIPPRNSPAMFYQAVENPESEGLYADDQFYEEWNKLGYLYDSDALEAVHLGWCMARLCRKYPLFRDPDTVQWWSEQSAEAQAAFANPVDLKEGLQLFAQWLAQVAPNPRDTRIYCHGQHFDLPIVEAACHAVGMEAPWFYRAPRDTRTLFDAAGIDDHSGYLDSFAQGDEIWHHSLDDAIVQARAAAAAIRKVRPLPPTALERVKAWKSEWLNEPRQHWGDSIEWVTAQTIARRLDGEDTNVSLA